MFTKDAPATLRNYLDHKAFARDLELGGDALPFDFCGSAYVVTGLRARNTQCGVTSDALRDQVGNDVRLALAISIANRFRMGADAGSYGALSAR